jgi:hypothetical protein
MLNQTLSEEKSPESKANPPGAPRWWEWARRHPQTLAAGVLLIAALVALAPHPKKSCHASAEAEEVPLFI